MGIDEVDHGRGGAGEAVDIARQRRHGRGIAARLRDFLRRQTQPRVLGIVARQRAAAQEGLDAARMAAIAFGAGQLVRARPGQGVVAPFAGDGVGSAHHLFVDHEAAAHAGAEDGAEHDFRIGARAVGGLRQRETVGVVGDAHRLPEGGGEIALQRMADEANRIGVLHQSRHRGNSTRNADAHGRHAGALGHGLGRARELRHGADRAGVVAHGCRGTLAEQRPPVAGQRDRLDLGAAEVDADPDVGGGIGHGLRVSTKGGPW